MMREMPKIKIKGQAGGPGINTLKGAEAILLLHYVPQIRLVAFPSSYNIHPSAEDETVSFSFTIYKTGHSQFI